MKLSPPYYPVWDVRGWDCWAESRLGGTSCSHLPLCCEGAQECQHPLPPLTAVWTHTRTHRCSTHTSNIQWQTEIDILANALNLYSQHRLQGEYIIFLMSMYVWRSYVGQIIGLIWLWNIANVLTSWVVSGASLLTVYANEKPYLKPFIYCYIVQ